MNRLIIIGALLLALLSGCSQSTRSLSGDAPPEVVVGVDGETFETILGSNCWGDHSVEKYVCTDTSGPVGLLENRQPIEVQAGEPITMNMDYNPQPGVVHLFEIENEVEKEIKVKNHQFTAPEKAGIYYYAYHVWWMDEEEEDVSNADAMYAFLLEVK